MQILYVALLAAVFAVSASHAQQPATSKTEATSVAKPSDAVVDVAANLVGRALFLRCFCSEDNLSFDQQGHIQGEPKTTDWTLAAMNVLKAERKGPGLVEVDGVRVAMRFAQDRHEWERHPQNDQKMKLLIADTGDPVAFERALKAVFSMGIEVAFQRSMPPYWQHYFDPQTPWPQDSVTGKTVYVPGPQPGGQVVAAAALEHKSQPEYTPEARKDKVQGTLEIHMVVDSEGAPGRLSVVQPLGYGLEEKVVTAASKFRFNPAKLAGAPVASNVLLKQEFTLVPTP